jgi:hypothetical protein
MARNSNRYDGTEDALAAAIDGLEQISALRGYQGEYVGRVAAYRIAAEIADAALASIALIEAAGPSGPKKQCGSAQRDPPPV